MVKGASLNVEYNLFQAVTCGDHIMFIGEVVDAIHNPEKQSLIYHGGGQFVNLKRITNTIDQD